MPVLTDTTSGILHPLYQWARQPETSANVIQCEWSYALQNNSTLH
jgi:hypothetical protein